MGEYKIIKGADSDCQKILNQWKHDYKLDIIHMCQYCHGLLAILLIREKKP